MEDGRGGERVLVRHPKRLNKAPIDVIPGRFVLNLERLLSLLSKVRSRMKK